MVCEGSNLPVVFKNTPGQESFHHLKCFQLGNEGVPPTGKRGSE